MESGFVPQCGSVRGLGFWICKPAGAAGFEQIKCADDIRVDEIARTGDGTVHVRFRREMHDVRDGVLFNDTPHGSFVAQVHFLKNIFRVFGNLFQIFKVPGVGEAIEIDEFGDLRAVNDVVNQI